MIVPPRADARPPDQAVVGEQRSEIARAVDFLQDAGEADIWSFFLRETVKQVEEPNIGDSDLNDVINSATAAATAGTDDARCRLGDIVVFAIPDVVVSLVVTVGMGNDVG